jgi:hypothetical protein
MRAGNESFTRIDPLRPRQLQLRDLPGPHAGTPDAFPPSMTIFILALGHAAILATGIGALLALRGPVRAHA